MLAGRLCSGGSMKPDELKKQAKEPTEVVNKLASLECFKETSYLRCSTFFSNHHLSIYLSVFPLEALNWHSYGQITAFQNGKSTTIPVHGFRMPVDQMLTPTLSNPLTIIHRYSHQYHLWEKPTISKSYVFPAFPAINLRFSQDHPRHRWRGSGRTRGCWGRALAASASCCAHRTRCRWWSTTPGTSAWHRGATGGTELARKLTVLSTVNCDWPVNKSGKWKPNETYLIFDILCY